MNFSIDAKDRHSQARATTFHTAHGMVKTPIFMPVGSLGTVKTLSPADLDQSGAQIILGNTYHLYLKPGLEILKKTVAVLEPGGLILIHDFLLNRSMDGPLFPALFSLNMLLGTASGQSYSEEQIADMLSRAGAKNIRRIPFDSPNDSGIMSGVV